MIMLCTRCYPPTPSLLQEDSINIISSRENIQVKERKVCVCTRHAMGYNSVITRGNEIGKPFILARFLIKRMIP